MWKSKIIYVATAHPRPPPPFFFDLGFTALSRIFNLYRAELSSKVGENQRTQEKKTLDHQ